MKVSEIPYKRYTIEEGKAAFAEVKTMIETAKCVEDILNAHEKMLKFSLEYQTAGSLAHCRFTLNTKDPFYQEEMEYYDENEPVFNQLHVEYGALMLASPLPRRA